jgi:hypothetical protein
MRYLHKLKRFLSKLVNTLSTYIHKCIDYPSYLLSIIKIQHDYLFVKKIGGGKDGVVFLAQHKKSGNQYILKVLSKYAKKYIDLTQYISELKIKSPAMYDFKVVDDLYIVYPYEQLHECKTDVENFLNSLVQLCELEEILSQTGVYYWDFGFQGHTNYLITNSGQIKLIDYSGNGFLLKELPREIQVTDMRKNLVIASNDFLQSQFLLHVIYKALGKMTVINYASLAQNASADQLLQIQDMCKKNLRGTVYEPIIEIVQSKDLLTSAGWAQMASQIKTMQLSEIVGTQEDADIESVTYVDGGVEVMGYQSYQIINKILIPISRKELKLWDTSKKFQLVNDALKQINTQATINSFLDIGSNLGLYVFNARINYNIENSVGYDYNKNYIDICNQIKETLQITGCNFEKVSFKNISTSFDCVVAMALIHHLYHRTEDYGSLDEIVKKFAEITNKYLIIEFPTEHDPKAKKWTNMPGRNVNQIYSQQNFLNAVSKYFSKSHVIGQITSTRITYLLVK